MDAYRRQTLLDVAALPVEDLAVLSAREGRRPRPIYGAHRWFARRFGTAFRALLTAAASPVGSDFWAAYYSETDLLHGQTVLDPFVGGGTSLFEALRLGANAVGVDVDAVACAITRFESRAADMPDLNSTLNLLKKNIGRDLSCYYQTTTPEGDSREVLHYFWVQLVHCKSCGEEVEAHPHFQLAYESEGDRQWVFCRDCHEVHTLDHSETHVDCRRCKSVTTILDGPVSYGRFTCPRCDQSERLIDVAARDGHPPRWRLFALETLESSPARRNVPLSERYFRPATKEDQSLYKTAERALHARRLPNGTTPWVPESHIPVEGRADDRLVRYGYKRHRELFNARQLLHLSTLAEAIDEFEGSEREAFALAFSDHLTTNCAMAHYAFGWRRVAPLFSVRAYRHVTRPVEINPWLDGTGRGTFPNAVRQVQRAIEFARSPKEPLLSGGFRVVLNPASQPKRRVSAPSVKVMNSDSRRLEQLTDESVDLVLTDPPYLDNVAYSELSDFYLPWLRMFGLAPPEDEGPVAFEKNLAAKGRAGSAVESYAAALGECFAETSRTLKPDGRLVFTYQHQTANAWHALASAVSRAGLKALQVFPLLGNGDVGTHVHEGTIRWDAVLVLAKDLGRNGPLPLSLSNTETLRAREHTAGWMERLASRTTCGFGSADRRNFYRACLVAGVLGMFPDTVGTDEEKPLSVALEVEPPGSQRHDEEVSDAAVS